MSIALDPTQHDQIRRQHLRRDEKYAGASGEIRRRRLRDEKYGGDEFRLASAEAARIWNENLRFALREAKEGESEQREFWQEFAAQCRRLQGRCGAYARWGRPKSGGVDWS